jgi:hypothetical protein
MQKRISFTANLLADPPEEVFEEEVGVRPVDDEDDPVVVADTSLSLADTPLRVLPWFNVGDGVLPLFLNTDDPFGMGPEEGPLLLLDDEDPPPPPAVVLCGDEK